MPIKDSKILGP
jgi:hypothetical protein